MAPVKKLAISMTTLSTIALVMSACGGHLEGKRLRGRTGVQAKGQATLELNQDAATTYNEACDASPEITKSEGEAEIKLADLVTNEDKVYVLQKSEVFTTISNKKTQKQEVLSGVSADKKATIVCHNISSANASLANNAAEISAKDGSVTAIEVAEFQINAKKSGTSVKLIERNENAASVPADTIAQLNLTVTKDQNGVVRIRKDIKQDFADVTREDLLLGVYKLMTKEEAAEQAQAQAVTEETTPEQDEPQTAKEAADALAIQAGIPIEEAVTATTTTTTQAESDSGSERQKTAEELETEPDGSGTVSDEEQAQLDAALSKSLQQTSAKLQAQLAATMTTTTTMAATTTTVPRHRAADEDDVKNGRGH